MTAAPALAAPQEITLETSSLETSVAPTSRTSDTNQVQQTEQHLTTPFTARTVCDDPASLEFRIGAPTSKDTELQGLLGALDGTTGGISYAAGMTPPTRLRLQPTGHRRVTGSQRAGAVVDRRTRLRGPPADRPGRAGRRLAVGADGVDHGHRDADDDGDPDPRDGDLATLDVAVDETPVNSVFAIPGSQATLHIAR